MSKLKSLVVFFAFALILIGAGAAMAQTAPVRGVVKMQSKDGTQTPVADAVVDVYETDLTKGSMPSTKTNKRGEFVFINLLLGKTYAIAISGQGISPRVQPNVKAGQEDIVIVTSEGDGRKPTEDEVRAFAANKGATAATSDPKALSKEQEEYQKKVAANDEAKKKAEDSNKIINAAFQEGDKLYKAKDYDAAIAKFDEGINADPEFEGSAPILLNYKAVALKDRAVAGYNKSMTGDDAAKAAAIEKTKADLTSAKASLDRAIEILNKATAPTDPTAQKNFATTKHNIYATYVDVLRLFVKTRADVSKAKEAQPIFDQYFAIETDPAVKASAHITLGEMMQDAGEGQAAVDAFTAAVEGAPENPDALAGLGFALVNLGYINNDKTKFQDGVNYLQKFVSVAPDTHKLKPDAVSLIDSLKKTENVTPQKVTTTRKKP